MADSPAKHAPIALSGLRMLNACEASVQLQASVPEQPETEEEAEGTAWHIVAAAHCSGNAWPMGVHFESGGRRWQVDADMWAGAVMLCKAMGGFHTTLRVEDPVRASRIHPTHCWGTPDVWRAFHEGLPWSKGLPVIRVAEYKAGHRYVEAFENVQLIGQAIGIMERLDWPNDDVWLELIVVQPKSYHRLGPVRTWKVLASDLRAIVNHLHDKAAAALAPNPIARTGPHCMDCKAAHVCETLMFNVGHVVQYAGKMQRTELSPAAMGQELRMLVAAKKLLEARETAISASVESVIRAGHPVPMWKLEPGRSPLKWNEDLTPDDIANIGDLYGLMLRKPLEVITPTQAKDAGFDEAALASFAARLPGAMKLKPDTTVDARKVFAYETPDAT